MTRRKPSNTTISSTIATAPREPREQQSCNALDDRFPQSPPLMGRDDYQVLRIFKTSESDHHSYYNTRNVSPISLTSVPGDSTAARLSPDDLVAQAPNHCQEKPHYLPKGDSVAEHEHRQKYLNSRRRVDEGKRDRCLRTASTGGVHEEKTTNRISLNAKPNCRGLRIQSPSPRYQVSADLVAKQGARSNEHVQHKGKQNRSAR